MKTNKELQEATRRKYIDPIIFTDEEWKKIDFINDIYSIYWISTYGRVYNEETGYVMDGHIASNGYVTVSFYKPGKVRVWAHVHRLVMIAFNPIENAELYVVNHIDGNKQNNHISNLEWTTQKGNVEHAFRTGLRRCGEDSSHALFTNEQIHSVCKCMEEGMNLNQLSYTVFNKEPDQQIMSLCQNIYSGKFWKDISSLYNVRNYKRSMIFSNPQVEIICKIIETNHSANTEEILNKLSIIPKNREEYSIYERAIWNIRRGKSFKHISSKYNI